MARYVVEMLAEMSEATFLAAPTAYTFNILLLWADLDLRLSHLSVIRALALHRDHCSIDTSDTNGSEAVR